MQFNLRFSTCIYRKEKEDSELMGELDGQFQVHDTRGCLDGVINRLMRWFEGQTLFEDTTTGMERLLQIYFRPKYVL